MCVEIRFRVFGLPQTKGSTKAFMRPGMRYPVVTNDNVKNAGWAATVKGEAQRAVREGGAGLPWAGAVGLALTFWLKKPQRHPKRRSVPAIKKPDLDKLVRSVKDALTGTMYLDDSQVTWLTARKVYGEQPGVLIQLTKGDVR